LNRFVTVFLETAELRVKDEKDITISFWKENIDLIIELNKKKLLDHKGSVSNKEMKEKVDGIYDKFDVKRKKADAELADNQDMKELKQIEVKIKEDQ